MSRHAQIELDWADGRHRFRLGMGELCELQDLCDAGPPVILQRLVTMQWRVQDIRDTIRLGLVGAGMTASDALVLVRRYVEDTDRQPSLTECSHVARVVLQTALFGPTDEQPDDDGDLDEGKSRAEGANSPSLTGSGAGATSTPTGSFSA